MNIGRKRIVLVEKFIPSKSYQNHPEAFRPLITPLFSNEELFVKNRFIVELERSDSVKIEGSRICGFKIENSGENKVLKVKTYLHIQEWLEDYEKVVIAKITILDTMGNEINNFDLDVVFDGYSMEFDYNSDGPMTPQFSYIIVGS